MTTVWSQQDTVDPRTRPGLYANFTSQATASIRGGIRGIVVATVKAPWGPGATVQEITTIKQVEDFYQKVDTGSFTGWFVLSNLLLGGVNKILAYRLLGPAAAKGTLTLQDTAGTPANVIRLDGKYEGARANNFTVTIAANPGNASRKDVTVEESGVQIIKWTTRVDNAGAGMIDDLVDQINEDVTNFYLTAVKLADGNNTLADITDSALTGGVDDEGNIVASDYTEATDAFALEDFEIAYFETQEADLAGIMTTLRTWVNTQRTNGKRILWVTGSEASDSVATAKTEAEGLNHEGVVYCHPGIKVNNVAGVETTYGGYLAAARVAGIIAGLDLTQSPTFRPLLSINDVEVRLSHSNLQDLLESGIVPLVYDGIRFKIERGINTLTTLASTQSNTFKKIRPIRILDNINNSIVNAVNNQVIGRIPNSVVGRDGVLNSVRSFLNTMVVDQLIAENFVVEEDPNNPPTLDRFFVKITLQPIDAIEFMFLTIEVTQ